MYLQKLTLQVVMQEAERRKIVLPVPTNSRNLIYISDVGAMSDDKISRVTDNQRCEVPLSPLVAIFVN